MARNNPLPPYYPGGKGGVNRQGYQDGFSPEQVVKNLLGIQQRQQDATLDQTKQSGLIALDQAAGWAEYQFLLGTDLTLDANNNPVKTKAIETASYGLLFRRENSAPMARLVIKSGGTLTDFYPGSLIRGFSRRWDLALSVRSVQAGFARLVAFTRPDAIWEEPHIQLPGEVFQPVDLLGASGTLGAGTTFVSVNKTTQPSGAPSSLTGAFTYTGFKSIRAYIDTGSSNQVTFDLVPWFYDFNTQQWAPQDLARVSNPAPAQATRYRTLFFDVAGSGAMFFEIPVLSAGTSLGFIVQGIG